MVNADENFVAIEDPSVIEIEQIGVQNQLVYFSPPICQTKQTRKLRLKFAV